jgi:hypothetical protein
LEPIAGCGGVGAGVNLILPVKLIIWLLTLNKKERLRLV